MSEVEVTEGSPSESVMDPAPPETSSVLQGQEPVADSGSFLDGIDTSIRNDPNISKFKNVNDLAKEHVNLQSLIGRKGVVLPKEGDPDEVWSNYRKEMDIPNDSSEYIQGVQDIGEFESKLAEIAHESNMSKTQFDKILSGYSDYYESSSKHAEQEATVLTEENISSLKEEWGRAYDAKANIGSSALNSLTNGNPKKIAEIQLADGTVLGNNPEFIKIMASVGESYQEKGLLDGVQTSGAQMSPEEAQRKLSELMSDSEKQAILFNSDFHPAKEELVRERERLLKFAYPED